ncbi:Os03g0192750 [Oryza sativa Japonica Group]|uniref:Os03g0192750 protein n=1 Tax=Oryza sativa subsp. japonica TaxID=39947 RepID=A0A0P0VU75_ORYSJ|nr:hypothetical protein EE612_015827 [Oryza sativa]BAS82736.1 Os03g0192750 [Oryza sativa Japonica Group]
MIGAARSESSQVLCRTMVLLPPMKISEVYSSIALLLSPTYGTYCRRIHGQDARQAHRGWHCLRPCHRPHCSWRSPWIGMFEVRKGSCHHYSPSGCS